MDSDTIEILDDGSEADVDDDQTESTDDDGAFDGGVIPQSKPARASSFYPEKNHQNLTTEFFAMAHQSDPL